MKSHFWKTLGLYRKQRHRNIVLEQEITLIIKRIDMDCGVAERILCRCFEFVFSGGRIPTLRYKQAPIYSKFKRSERSSSSSEKTSSNFSLKWSLHASFHANEFSEEKLWWCENLCHVVVWVHTSTTTHTQVHADGLV